MNGRSMRIKARYALLLASTWISVSAMAQEINLVGEWRTESYEEDGGIGCACRNRGQGSPEGVVAETLGNYLGLALNESGRRKALTWDASQYSHPALQVKSHPMQFYMRGFMQSMRLEAVIDDYSQLIIGLKMIGGWGANEDRVIWLDGRSPPPDYAEHTWHGFSVGRWQNGMLVVTTTQISDGHLRRNRAPASRNSVVTEYFIRRGERLTHVYFVDDPAYLSEPHVTTTDFIVATDGRPSRRFPRYWDTAEEVPWPPGYVPHYPIGTRHTDVADILGLPVESTEGGQDTLYPEYRKNALRNTIRFVPNK